MFFHTVLIDRRTFRVYNKNIKTKSFLRFYHAHKEASQVGYITFENVCKYYQTGDTVVKAVDNVSFTIEKGEFCVVLGPSGAGKTTILNLLGGMDKATSGRITVLGSSA